MRVVGAIGAVGIAVMLTACTVGGPSSAPPPTPERSYEWIQEYESMTVTIIEGSELDEVLHAFGADGYSATRDTYEQALDRQAEAYQSFGDTAVLLVATSQDPIVIIEPNGFLGVDAVRLAALSEAGSAVSVYWNVNALMTFSVAERGDLVRSFDFLIPEVPQIGDPLPEEEQVPLYEPGFERSAALSLAERITGVAIDERWFREPLPSWTSTAQY
jgi:hypothetical protein